MSLLRAGPGKLFDIMEKKKGLTRLEKTAIVVIIILVIIIVGLIFKDRIEEYIKIFMEWYTAESQSL
jgi:hypothetical protein